MDVALGANTASVANPPICLAPFEATRPPSPHLQMPADVSMGQRMGGVPNAGCWISAGIASSRPGMAPAGTPPWTVWRQTPCPSSSTSTSPPSCPSPTSSTSPSSPSPPPPPPPPPPPAAPVLSWTAFQLRRTDENEDGRRISGSIFSSYLWDAGALGAIGAIRAEGVPPIRLGR